MRDRSDGERGGRSAWHALLGVAFILGGLALLADRAGWLDIGPLWHWWPLILMVLGLARLIFDRPDERSGGIWLLAAGIYCGIGVWEPYGLSWVTGWPVMVVALGATLLFESTPFGGCERPRRRTDGAAGSDSRYTKDLQAVSPEGEEVRHDH
jgi:hypothetical protein